MFIPFVPFSRPDKSIGELSCARIREKSVIDYKGVFQEEWHLPPSRRHGM